MKGGEDLREMAGGQLGSMKPPALSILLVPSVPPTSCATPRSWCCSGTPWASPRFPWAVAPAKPCSW